MARYFLGQPVRVVRPDRESLNRSLCVGDEGRIDADEEILYRIKVTGKINPYSRDDTFPVTSDEIEPIFKAHAPAQETHEQLMERLRAGVVGNVDG